MKILIVAKHDHSGAGYALYDAINSTTPHKAMAVSFETTWISYPYHVLRPDAKRLLKLIEWADVVNLHDGAEGLLPKGAPRRPVVTTYHGTWFRRQHARIMARDKAKGYLSTCLTLDLVHYGPRWIGRAIRDASSDLRPSTHPHSFVVTHSPSQPHRKGTETIKKTLAGLADVTLDVITKVPWEESLRRKARSHLFIDKILPKASGPGTSALEAWALGLPVICDSQEYVLKQFDNHVGYVPFCWVRNADVLRRSVELFRDEYNDIPLRQSLWAMWARVGRRFWMEHHSPNVVASKFIKACNEVL